MATDPYNPLVPDQKLLNEVKFAARDFASMADDLLRRLKILYVADYNDYATTAVAMMLRDLVAWAHANIGWYNDRTASDSFLRTSRTHAAAERLVEQIGYKMASAAASSTTATVTFPNGTSAGFTMGARWQFQGPQGLVFESYADKIVTSALAAGDSIDIDIRQGESRTLTYTSDGSKNQSYRLTSVDDDRYLGVGATEVWVDGSLWTEVDFLEFAPENIYEISYMASPPRIRFGDGTAGNVPPVGAEIKVRFLVIDGKKGNVKDGTITQSIDTLVIGGEQVTIEVTNEAGSSGGTDPEDLDRAKRLAPISFAARGAAITEQDYEGLSQSYVDATYGRVAKSYAFNPRSSYSDVVFNDYVNETAGYLTAYRATVDGLEDDVVAASDSLTPLLDSLNNGISDLADLNTDLQGYIGSAAGQVSGGRTQATQAQNNASLSKQDCQTSVTNIDALIAWINSSSISSGDKASLISGDGTGGDPIGLNTIRGDVNRAQGESLSAETTSGAAVAAMDSASSFLSSASVAVNTDVPASLTQLSSDASDIEDVLSNPTTGLQAQLAGISGLAATLDSDISGVLTSMQLRIGDLFSDDCLSNYVQVPILAIDSEGNYSAPSAGLMIGLQTYLNSIKEVTQVVEVIDGSSILVPAEIVIDVEIIDSYVNAEVTSQIEATVVGMTKGRDFDDPLYLSDLYENVKASSAGIKRVNIQITGPVTVPPVIVGENLVPEANQVIILGSLTINVVA